MCPNSLTIIYGGDMPIYMSHIKLFLFMMYQESLYTDDDDEEEEEEEEG